MPSYTDKDQGNVARGLKAAIHNDNVSEEAKENAAQRLEQMGSEVPADFSSSGHSDTSDLQSNQTRGYKSASSRGDESAEMLEGDLKGTEDSGKETNRVLGGYKAALKNPNVSEEAKEHAEEVLREAYD